MSPINSKFFMHDFDRRALQTLNDIPAFPQIMKFIMKNGVEKMYHMQKMSNCIRISENQLPEYYHMLLPICEKLGIDVPELYLEPGSLNAYTYGDTNPIVVITTELLRNCTEEEIKSVIAHECGHIACHHTLYRTVANMLFDGTLNIILPVELTALISTALYISVNYWYRCSEFSADRAAAICMGGYETVQDVMLRASGAYTELDLNINKEEFIKQGEEYFNYVSSNGWNKALEFAAFMHYDHPMNTVRALEIEKWCKTKTFENILAGCNENLIGPAKLMCPNCGSQIEDGWAFCRKCGHKL